MDKIRIWFHIAIKEKREEGREGGNGKTVDSRMTTNNSQENGVRKTSIF